jgi:HEAT repeat protein
MLSIDETLNNLVDADEPVSVARLYAFSNLERADMEKVRSTWPTIPAGRRHAAMRHLVEIAEDNFEVDFNPIYRLGLTDHDADVRVAAIEGLWEDTDAALIAPLLDLLKTEEADRVRAAAATALGRFLYEGEIEEIPAERIAPVTAALKAIFARADEPLEVRRRALESLGYLGYEEVGPLIQQGYQHLEEPMRLSAVFAMGRSYDERWGEIVKQELDSTNPEMRFEAAHACGELEYTPALRRLVELIEDVDEDVQRAAVWALGQIGGDKARQVLEYILDSEADHLYDEAEAALDELEFKGDQLNLAMFDFDDEDEEEWVLDQDFDDDEDD